MKDEIIVDGIRYKRAEEPKELTLEDCIKGNQYFVNPNGCIGKNIEADTLDYDSYPTIDIVNKVLLYGLLQSVAYKLNEGKEGLCCICFHDKSLCTTRLCPAHTNYGVVLFASKELAEQAIRIFENSKFDLKKLFQ